MDWLSRGYVTVAEFIQAIDNLADPGLVKTKSDIESLTKRFNKDKIHGRVTLKEFIDEVTPKIPSKPY